MAGIVAYVCLVGCLFLASLRDESQSKQKHKSFRLTPQARRRVRVKPHLLRHYLAASVLQPAIMILALIVQYWVARFWFRPAGQLGWVALMAILSLALSYLALFAFKVLSVELGWLTPEEARSYPYGKHIPDAWFESVEEDDGL